MDIEKKKEIVIQKMRQELYEECGISQKRSINGSNRDDRSPSERAVSYTHLTLPTNSLV